MGFLSSLRRLWRHRYFRRLLAVRVATQTCDGVLQIALASFVLFSPERQPDAASIAAVLAITLLPFSVLGPFVGIVLDRWSRRQILLVVELVRCGLALGLAALVSTGLRDGSTEAAIYGLVLLAMSLNRLLLAALSASLPHTIDSDEYLIANAVVPTVGPAGVLVGAAVGTGLRLALGTAMSDYQANAFLFVLAAVGYLTSATLALRIPRRQLGPDQIASPRAAEIVTGLVAAVAHLRERRAAGLGLLTIGAHRVGYGLVTVAMILVYRNHFHTLDQVEAAIADLGLLVAATGAGFVLAAAVTPPAIARIGLRAFLVVALVGSGVFQALPGSIIQPAALLVAAFLLGLTAQAVKICVDTLVQAHVADDYKGRVFVIYDMIFNVVLVGSAALGALVLPADGASVPILLTVAAGYVLIGIGFAAASRGITADDGTGSVRSAPSARR